MQFKVGFLFLTSEFKHFSMFKWQYFQLSTEIKNISLLQIQFFDAQTDSLHSKYVFINNSISNFIISKLIK